MTNTIKKFEFRQNDNPQIEVITLQSFKTANQNLLSVPHRTTFYHILLFKNCHPIHFVDFEPIQIEPYSLLFIDKNRVHQFDKKQQYQGSILIFTDDFFCVTQNDTNFLRSSVLFNDVSSNTIIKLNKEDFQKFDAICLSINQELSLPFDRSKHIILKNWLQNFLLFAQREKDKKDLTKFKKSIDQDYTLLFLDILESNYNKLKNVNNYAQLICISKRRLGQATVKILGKSPKEIINDRVLLEAKRLLVYTNLSIKEIGQEIGFEDSSYFVRFFKKMSKTTPVEFRRVFLEK